MTGLNIVTLTTKSGHKIELKKELNGFEFEEIQKTVLTTSEDPLTSIKVLDKTIEVYVISFDGSKDDIINKIKGLLKSEYLEVINKINELHLESEKKSDI